MGTPSTFDRLGRLLGVLLVALAGLSAFGASSPILAAPQPALRLSLEPSTSVFIGEIQRIGISFDNHSSSAPGYGPYVDLFLPAAGADGSGLAADDGLTFAGASLLQAGPIEPLAPTPLICAGSTFTHPLTRRATPCLDGEQVLVFELPFSNVTPAQPAQQLAVDALLSSWADPGRPLRLRVGGGFWLGNDPLDNPASDPPISVSGAPLELTPLPPFALSVLSQSPDSPDAVDPGPRFGETATGYSFPQHFSLTLDIPAGQTITNLRLTDLLPPTMVYSGVTRLAPATCALVKTPLSTIGPQPPPRNELTVGCPSITGQAGPNDVAFTFTYWVPRLDADGRPVLDPATGALRMLGDDATASGDWQPLDPRDSPFPITISPDGPEDRVRAQSIAIQHSVSHTPVIDPQGNGLSPGDTLEHTLSFQVSDYFAFDSVVITDTLSDGQRYLPGSARLSLTDREDIVDGAFTDGVSLSVDTSRIGNTGPGPDGTDGSTTLTFDVSRAMRDLGAPDGIVRGAQSALPRGTGARGTVTFRVLVQERFSDSYPSGDPSVDLWDTLTSEASIGGQLVDTIYLPTPPGSVVYDTPHDLPPPDDEHDNQAVVELPGPSFATTVYAINGVACEPQPCADPVIEPADTVTFRLTYQMPFVDVEGPELRDYLPLPVFAATEVLTASPILANGLPPPGRVAYGPGDSFHTLPGAPAPSPGVDLDNNVVSFSYAGYDLDGSPAGAIDLLFTVTASDRPFDRQLALAIQASASELSSSGPAGRHEHGFGLVLGLEPLVLRLRKGVVASTSVDGVFQPAVIGPVHFASPGAPACPRFSGAITSRGLAEHPIDSNLRNVNPGERLTFAVVIENYGPSANGAFDVTLRDDLPSGLIPTSAPICVTDGAGSPIVFSERAGGLFGAGITLDDPGATLAPAGALDPYSPDGGRNIAIITYDVRAADTGAAQTRTNTATLLRYTDAEGGADDGRDKVDPAEVTITRPTAITLLSFAAAREGNQVIVRWTTGVELRTRGFLLLRSDDGSRAGAVPVTPQPIPARGRGGVGAAYVWPDPVAPPGRRYAYWLVEVELGGAVAEYGPARVGATLQHGIRLALPLVGR